MFREKEATINTFFCIFRCRESLFGLKPHVTEISVAVNFLVTHPSTHQEEERVVPTSKL